MRHLSSTCWHTRWIAIALLLLLSIALIMQWIAVHQSPEYTAQDRVKNAFVTCDDVDAGTKGEMDALVEIIDTYDQSLNIKGNGDFKGKMQFLKMAVHKMVKDAAEFKLKEKSMLENQKREKEKEKEITTTKRGNQENENEWVEYSAKKEFKEEIKKYITLDF